MLVIGGILYGLGAIGCLVFYIIAIVKAFKAGDTLWGVLNIFIGICGLIWLFMNGQKKLGIYYIVAIVVCLIGAIITGAGAASMEGMGQPVIQ